MSGDVEDVIKEHFEMGIYSRENNLPEPAAPPNTQMYELYEQQ